jgi:replicative DNA helicase
MTASDYMLPESVVDAEIEVLPSAPDIEKAILGGIMQDNLHLNDALSVVHVEDFYLDSHRTILRRMIEMESAGRAIDFQTLSEELRRNKESDSAGGIGYLASLTEGLPRKLSILDYANVVLEKSMRRQTMILGAELTRRASESTETASELLAWAGNRATGICEHIGQASLESQSEEEFELLMKQRRGEAALFLPSGIAPLDAYSGGFARGEMTVIGGRPKQGKSCCVSQATVELCQKGIYCHIFSVEMRSGQFLRRIWSKVSGVPFWKLRRSELMSDTELSYVRGAMRDVERWPLLIDDGSNYTAADIAHKARVSKRKKGTQFVAIDYLQKLRFPGKASDKFAGVTEAAQQLAKLAKDEYLAVLLLSSLTEKTGNSRNNPPTMQDLRMSGDIQFEANCIYLIHREIDDSTEKIMRKGQIIQAAARSDEGGAFEVEFDKDFLMFR